MTKTIPELLAAVRNCHDEADVHCWKSGWFAGSVKITPAASTDLFKAGHRAACDRLVPALKEAIERLEEIAIPSTELGMVNRVDEENAHEGLQEIRALLEGKA